MPPLTKVTFFGCISDVGCGGAEPQMSKAAVLDIANRVGTFRSVIADALGYVACMTYEQPLHRCLRFSASKYPGRNMSTYGVPIGAMNRAVAIPVLCCASPQPMFSRSVNQTRMSDRERSNWNRPLVWSGSKISHWEWICATFGLIRAWLTTESRLPDHHDRNGRAEKPSTGFASSRDMIGGIAASSVNAMLVRLKMRHRVILLCCQPPAVASGAGALSPQLY